MISKKIYCKNISFLPEVASLVLAECTTKKIALFGNLGAGKTSLIKEMCKILGVTSLVNSPTFTILNEYHGNITVYHFDFYRLKKAEELYELGYEEYFFSDDYVFIEWAESIGDMLPDFFTKLFIEIGEGEERFFSLTS